MFALMQNNLILSVGCTYMNTEENAFLTLALGLRMQNSQCKIKQAKMDQLSVWTCHTGTLSSFYSGFMAELGKSYKVSGE